MIGVIGLIIGIVLGVLLDPTVPAWLAPFLPVAVVAGLDALFGAGRAWLEGRFADRVFVTGRRRCAGYSNFLEHRVDPPSAPEGLT